MNAAESISVALKRAKKTKQVEGIIRKCAVEDILESVNGRLGILVDGTIISDENVDINDLVDSDWVLVSDLKSAIIKALEELE